MTKDVMDTQSSLLSVRNLKTYFFMDEGIVKAVDGVSFDVNPGQVLGIVGESGCGKSVTIKSVLRIVEEPGRIVEGEILFRRQNGASKGAEGYGQVVDLAKFKANGSQIRSIRGGEIAVEAIQLHQPVSKAKADHIAIERLHEVGVPNPEQRMDAYSWELSGGLRQRAMIAMALSCNPRLLIADEPTTAIDVTTQAQVLNLLRSLQQHHDMAIIFITHDLGVIAQVADYVVVMYLGRLMETGPVDDIFHNPQHPYTKALLESIPSILSQPRTALPTIEGSIPHPFNRPSGCPFYPRCSEFMPDVCNRRTPSLQPVNNRQSASCFLYHDVTEEMVVT
jgi:peptide/nickel transport system ATP-binding protein